MLTSAKLSVGYLVVGITRELDKECYDSMLKGLSKELTLVLSDTRELDRVPSTE